MKWIEALSKWNKEINTGKWMIPKKTSKEYLEIRQLMGDTPVKSTTTVKKPRKKRTKIIQ
jgi:hypothetical protein